MHQQIVVKPRAVALHSCTQLNPTLPVFDLENVMERVKLDHPDWNETKLNQAESGYRCFLALCKTEPKKKVRPTKTVDEVWHSHILFTRQYHEDCKAYFGYYLHHRPLASDSPMEGEDMNAMLKARQLEGLGLCCRGYCDPDVNSEPQEASTCTGSGCMNNGIKASSNTGVCLPMGSEREDVPTNSPLNPMVSVQ